MNEKSEISLLLGAGFSVPMGYPSAAEVNNIMLNFNRQPVSFSLDGSIVTSTDGTIPFIGQYNLHKEAYNKCLEIIKWYNHIYREFDYEKFYDFIKFGYKDSEDFKEIFLDSVNQNQIVCQSMSSIHYIYEQMIQFLIRDRNGQRFYNVNDCASVVSIYLVFLDFINKCIDRGITINVHTLNHDLLFESFNLSGKLKDKICDGFDDKESFYWADTSDNNGNHECLLKKYTGQYDKGIRLFKLHGSIDYIPYKKTVDGRLQYDNYLKIPPKTRLLSLRLKNEKGEIVDRDFTHYHSDFLSGAIYKISRYKQPFYEGLFESFQNNLQNSSLLIIIGYAGKDSCINEYIKKNYDYNKKPIYIIDPTPNVIFADNIKANLIKKGINSLTEDDIDIIINLL